MPAVFGRLGQTTLPLDLRQYPVLLETPRHVLQQAVRLAGILCTAQRSAFYIGSSTLLAVASGRYGRQYTCWQVVGGSPVPNDHCCIPIYRCLDWAGVSQREVVLLVGCTANQTRLWTFEDLYLVPFGPGRATRRVGRLE